MSDQVTLRVNSILEAVKEHWDKYGLPPTIRWLGTRTGIPSTSTVARYIKRLMGQGLLEVTRGPGGPPKIARPGDEDLPLQGEVRDPSGDEQ